MRKSSSAALLLCSAVMVMLVLGLAPGAGASVSTGDGGWVWQAPRPAGQLDRRRRPTSTPRPAGPSAAPAPSSCSTDGGVTWEARRRAPWIAHGHRLRRPRRAAGRSAATAPSAPPPTAARPGRRRRRDDLQLQGVAAVGDDHAWAVGSYAKIYATTDGGANWIRPGLHRHRRPPRRRRSSTRATGWVSTSVEGAHDDRRRRHLGQRDGKITGTLLDVSFADATHVWAAGNASGALRASTDGGVTWAAGSRRPSAATCTASTSSRVTVGWAAGDDTIVGTTDGGASWHDQRRRSVP